MKTTNEYREEWKVIWTNPDGSKSESVLHRSRKEIEPYLSRPDCFKNPRVESRSVEVVTTTSAWQVQQHKPHRKRKASL